MHTSIMAFVIAGISDLRAEEVIKAGAGTILRTDSILLLFYCIRR